ncbi:hypothetical protein CHS0354_036054 [Potamilus streckersoni]|uniref:Uncharacterized protein n=1 Tax=Potamilus streckersoni TaxID=2493646 RepID=A0AAE0VWD1_9BIVA|nr:hypothetical protein CHS0354_036054 [Potamilus streckersoni]
MNALLRAVLMSLLIVVLTSECLVDGTTNEPHSRRKNWMRSGGGKNNGRRRVGPAMSGNRGLPPELRALHQEATRPEPSVASDWTRFTPRPPSSDEIQCYAEVKVTERVPGRCIQLWQSPLRVCQAGIHLDLYSDDCEQLESSTTQTSRTDTTRESTGGNP